MSAIEAFASLIGPQPTDWCFPTEAAETNGQFDCEMFTSHNMVVNPLPACAGDPWQAASPCWQLVADPSCASGRGLQLGAGFRMYHPRVIGRCVVAN